MLPPSVTLGVALKLLLGARLDHRPEVVDERARPIEDEIAEHGEKVSAGLETNRAHPVAERLTDAFEQHRFHLLQMKTHRRLGDA